MTFCLLYWYSFLVVHCFSSDVILCVTKNVYILDTSDLTQTYTHLHGHIFDLACREKLAASCWRCGLLVKRSLLWLPFRLSLSPSHLSAVGVMGNTAESETTRHSCFWANHMLLFGCHHVFMCQLCCQGFASLARMCQEHYAEWGLPLFTPTGIQHGLWI